MKKVRLSWNLSSLDTLPLKNCQLTKQSPAGKNWQGSLFIYPTLINVSMYRYIDTNNLFFLFESPVFFYPVK